MVTTQQLVHPKDALFSGEKSFPIIPSCEHFAGSEKLILKALSMQDTIGPVFDITCDCEDGAQAGQERDHAEMIVRVLTSEANKHQMAGARIHDYTHPAWKQDVDILVGGAGQVLSYITIPKCTSYAQASEMIAYIQKTATFNGIEREIPVHILIETHGALKTVHEIATLPWVQVLDFGLMDFVSGHHGAIPASAMRSPGQFEHRLLARAKAELVAAALANGVVPAHNVTLDLKNVDTTHSDASRARNEFGFLRMWSIYPTQIEAIVDAMKPNFDEVQDGANILLAAQKADWGPIQYDGELHDRATYRYFWEILQKAKLTKVAIPAEAAQAFFS
ncbi:MAG: aldolase/citrate lyase family protein [Methylotenera sp.]|uniref:HpcH/HpaI aldolase/citrate lyase family protein n=1 Tax=Methylotenera sp. TaxID=2051956 RepID=UPI0027218948|nr:aldolase/citrate lyase family protein [Methylotenera sp.]MDO9205673.1 aldolase/citrate lyase family protein [Methylotenera sp.]MDO9393240.1 aldolase/citrate lyase family protein [Methylotenera sp.]MDP1523702.1 aldolase/citrate lyase family protein [Methylotenera sp.]MDP3306908.1 aldolase/citrate lyase family protein [Methylotenera sp.]MDP3819333.1 aldolase/citrate lyase family protein [Methylotenera sp.]